MPDEMSNVLNQSSQDLGEGGDQRSCPGCSSSSVARILTVNEMMFGSSEHFRYIECDGCGTLRLANVPDDLGMYYPRTYYSVADDPQLVLGRRGVRSVIKVVGRSALGGSNAVAGAVGKTVGRREVQTLLSIYSSLRASGQSAKSSSRVLDVGAGSGMLVYALSLAGFGDVVGIDPFADGDRVFDTGASIRTESLGQMSGPGAWDMIMFNHSFEHVADPRADLAAALELLAPGGAILVRMPTVSSWAWRKYGVEWVQLDAPRHLTLFSRKGMTALAESVGLKIYQTRDDSTAFQFWGSEQVIKKIALDAPNSHMVNEKQSPFSAQQIKEWAARAVELNAAGDGDQVAWIMGRS